MFLIQKFSSWTCGVQALLPEDVLFLPSVFSSWKKYRLFNIRNSPVTHKQHHVKTTMENILHVLCTIAIVVFLSPWVLSFVFTPSFCKCTHTKNNQNPLSLNHVQYLCFTLSLSPGCCACCSIRRLQAGSNHQSEEADFRGLSAPSCSLT